MKIEVATAPGATTKDKGDLLEHLSKKLLIAQSYEVIEEIRFTAVELDLLCKHVVSGKVIYVECKAHRNNIDANVLKNLAGTLLFKEYDEGWLISTAELGKEAKGFVNEWHDRKTKQDTRLSFYTPELVIAALINSGTIKGAPTHLAEQSAGSANLLGEWTLSLTTYGTFWFCTKLSGGMPVEVMAFYANNNEPVIEEDLLKKLSQTDTTLAELNFIPYSPFQTSVSPASIQFVDVVTVQYGDSWSDYRPSRPEDFVGRDKDQESVLTLFRAIISRKTPTRIFAITGDSGMGKSSLVAKIADRANALYKRKKFFVYPVDIRAATSPSYIYSALLRCLRSAQSAGFGNADIEINITDVSSPLNSSSIKEFLSATEANGQLIVLILDQFEELYTKPELYDVFDRAKSLLLSCTALGGNLCLGFAWKSDSTTPNEHPAYYFWHELSDYRLTRKLTPFSDPDSNAVLNIFEKQIGQKLQNDLRHNLLVSSQGYPWLLKKLCIHLFDQMESGTEQKDLLENELDIRSLFDSDLNQLSNSERACLDFVAKRAPVDWFEVIETSTTDTLNSLIHRRLVIKSGDRLNVYWDIFREYLLTKKVPVIPLRYLPSTEFSSIWRVVQTLSHDRWISVQEIARQTGFSEGTVQNIGTDINMFGIALRDEGTYQLVSEIDVKNVLSLSRKAREKFKKHAFSLALQSRPSNNVIAASDAVEILKEIFPNNTYADNTWHVYTIKLCRWLELCGLLSPVNGGWIYRDKGDVKESGLILRTKLGDLFIPSSSPRNTEECLDLLRKTGTINIGDALLRGYKGAFKTLLWLDLATKENEKISLTGSSKSFDIDCRKTIFNVSHSQRSMIVSLDILSIDPNLSAKEFGDRLNEIWKLNWSESTKLRFGRPMKQWAEWIKTTQSVQRELY